MRRPVGVTLGSVLHFFVAGLFLLFVFGMADPQMWLIFPDADMRISEIAFVVISGTFAIVGWGLLTLKNWGRIAAIVLVLLDFLATHISGNLIGLEVPSLIRVFIGLLMFFYLDSPDIKAAFQTGGR